MCKKNNAAMKGNAKPRKLKISAKYRRRRNKKHRAHWFSVVANYNGDRRQYPWFVAQNAVSSNGSAGGSNETEKWNWDLNEKTGTILKLRGKLGTKLGSEV
jgi:hypothetical protein